MALNLHNSQLIVFHTTVTIWQ